MLFETFQVCSSFFKHALACSSMSRHVQPCGSLHTRSTMCIAKRYKNATACLSMSQHVIACLVYTNNKNVIDMLKHVYKRHFASGLRLDFPVLFNQLIWLIINQFTQKFPCLIVHMKKGEDAELTNACNTKILGFSSIKMKLYVLHLASILYFQMLHFQNDMNS